MGFLTIFSGITAKMNIFNLLRHSKRMFYKKGLPIQLIFFVTNRCNSKCIHCFYKNNLNQKTDELTIDEIESFSKTLKSVLWLALTGGEPYLRKDFPEITKVLYKNMHPEIITITTNALQKEKTVLDTVSILKECKKSNIMVYVSIDGLNQTHEKIRGVSGCFGNTISTFKELQKLKNNFKNFSLSTITTLNPLNQEEMPLLMEFIQKELRPDNMFLNLLRGDVVDKTTKETSIKKYLEFFKLRDLLYAQPKPNFLKKILQSKERIQHRLIAETYEKNRFVTPCYAGNLSAVINETGDVYPCEMLDKKMGNLRKSNYNFPELWFSKQADEVRDYIKRSKCFCTYECAMTTNVFFNPAYIPKIIANYFK